MDKYNWKQLKGIVDGFTIGDKPSNIVPILAYASEFPIRLRSALGGVIELIFYNEEKYTFVVTLIKKNKKYLISIRAFSFTGAGETPMIFESESFPTKDITAAKGYLNSPLKYFDLKGRHIRVMTFTNSPMPEEAFKDIIELWRTQPSQIKS